MTVHFRGAAIGSGPAIVPHELRAVAERLSKHHQMSERNVASLRARVGLTPHDKAQGVIAVIQAVVVPDRFPAL